MPVWGVNLPNLFILTYKEDDQQFYINVFNKGLIFLKEDTDNYIQHLHLNQDDIYYQPCTNLEIVQRAMRNLMVAYEKVGDHEKVEEVKVLLKSIS